MCTCKGAQIRGHFAVCCFRRQQSVSDGAMWNSNVAAGRSSLCQHRLTDLRSDIFLRKGRSTLRRLRLRGCCRASMSASHPKSGRSSLQPARLLTTPWYDLKNERVFELEKGLNEGSMAAVTRVVGALQENAEIMCWR